MFKFITIEPEKEESRKKIANLTTLVVILIVFVSHFIHIVNFKCKNSQFFFSKMNRFGCICVTLSANDFFFILLSPRNSQLCVHVYVNVIVLNTFNNVQCSIHYSLKTVLFSSIHFTIPYCLYIIS